MEQFVLKTHLEENPDVVLYYKGIEGSSALDVAVAFSIDDALAMSAAAANRLCRELNKDKELLHSHGYAAFEVVSLGLDIAHDIHLLKKFA